MPDLLLGGSGVSALESVPVPSYEAVIDVRRAAIELEAGKVEPVEVAVEAVALVAAQEAWKPRWPAHAYQRHGMCCGPVERMRPGQMCLASLVQSLLDPCLS